MTKQSDRLIPADPERCQAEIKEGSFMTLGPRSYVRCSNKTTWIATEAEPGPDGKRGSMSLCDECKKVCEKQVTGLVFRRLKGGKRP